jgi:hypothetical protein
LLFVSFIAGLETLSSAFLPSCPRDFRRFVVDPRLPDFTGLPPKTNSEFYGNMAAKGAIYAEDFLSR